MGRGGGKHNTMNSKLRPERHELTSHNDKIFGSDRKNEILQIENKAQSLGKVCYQKASWENYLCKIKKIYLFTKRMITPYFQNLPMSCLLHPVLSLPYFCQQRTI